MRKNYDPIQKQPSPLSRMIPSRPTRTPLALRIHREYKIVHRRALLALPCTLKLATLDRKAACPREESPIQSAPAVPAEMVSNLPVHFRWAIWDVKLTAILATWPHDAANQHPTVSM